VCSRLCQSQEPKKLYRRVDTSYVLHRLLGKFRFWTRQIENPHPTLFCWIHAPDAPEDMQAFERDVLTFLDTDSDVHGKKHSRIIDCATIGKNSWLAPMAGVALSKDFVAKLIKKLPNLEHSTIYSNSDKHEIFDAIGSSRKFKHIEILTTDGTIHRDETLRDPT
jgi:hypothetical protein